MQPSKTHRRLVPLLLLLALASSSVACQQWSGVRKGPSARLYFDARLPETPGANLRVEVHDMGETCPPPRLHFYSASYRGYIPATDPPYTVELPANRRIWLSFLYNDSKVSVRLLTGFELREGGEYVALYRNDGKRFGFAVSDSGSGTPIPLVTPHDCAGGGTFETLFRGLFGGGEVDDEGPAPSENPTPDDE